MKTCGEIFDECGTAKNQPMHSYGPVYDILIGHLRFEPRRVLEIGVDQGCSLRAWQQIFPPGSEIIGVDNVEDRIWPEGTTRIIADGFSYQSIFEKTTDDAYDLVVDDAHHNLTSHLITWATFVPRLKPGGVLVIEDINNEQGMNVLRELGAEIIDRRDVKGQHDDVLAVFHGWK